MGHLLDGPSAEIQQSVNPEQPSLTFRKSNKRIAIDAENGTITFNHCFVPSTGLWTVESYTCSLSDVVRAFQYSQYDEQRRNLICIETEIVTTAGRVRIGIDPSKQSKRSEGLRLRDICHFLQSEGYVNSEEAPPRHSFDLEIDKALISKRESHTHSSDYLRPSYSVELLVRFIAGGLFLLVAVVVLVFYYFFTV